jgi:hypothetical protein
MAYKQELEFSWPVAMIIYGVAVVVGVLGLLVNTWWLSVGMLISFIAALILTIQGD